MNYSSFVTTSNALEFFLVVTRKRLPVVNLYDLCFIQGDGSDNVDTGGEPKKKKKEKKKKKKKKKKKSGSKKSKTENSDINSLDEEDNFAEMEFINNAIKATKAVKKSQNEKRKKRQK